MPIVRDAEDHNEKMEEGEYFAIETFGSTGNGYVRSGVSVVYLCAMRVLITSVVRETARTTPRIWTRNDDRLGKLLRTPVTEHLLILDDVENARRS